jgi:hypothetical protein
MTWLDARTTEDAGIPELWNLLSIHIEQSAASYGSTTFARDHNWIAASKRIGNCVHVIRASASINQPEVSMDVCLDKSGRRVFSRVGDEEQKSLRIGLDAKRNVSLIDDAGIPMTNDQATRFFLEKFLFPNA